MACGSCGQRRSGSPVRDAGGAQRSASAALAGSSVMYEVITGRGTPTGRRFSTLVAATSYAQRIGGTTRPV